MFVVGVVSAADRSAIVEVGEHRTCRRLAVLDVVAERANDSGLPWLQVADFSQRCERVPKRCEAGDAAALFSDVPRQCVREALLVGRFRHRTRRFDLIDDRFDVVASTIAVALHLTCSQERRGGREQRDRPIGRDELEAQTSPTTNLHVVVNGSAEGF